MTLLSVRDVWCGIDQFTCEFRERETKRRHVGVFSGLISRGNATTIFTKVKKTFIAFTEAVEKQRAAWKNDALSFRQVINAYDMPSRRYCKGITSDDLTGNLTKRIRGRRDDSSPSTGNKELFTLSTAGGRAPLRLRYLEVERGW
jgi:hypothetical protein